MFNETRYQLMAWVVMPNHVHVLIQQFEGWPLGKIVLSWKSYTGKLIRKYQKQVTVEQQQSRAGARRSQEQQQSRSPAVWQRGYWDRYIRNKTHFKRAVDYIHLNPVKAGLVTVPEEWRFSSASTL